MATIFVKALTKIKLLKYIDVSRCTNLTELCVEFGFENADMQNLAMKLTNLQRLIIYEKTDYDISPFFQHSPKLKVVIFLYEVEGTLNLNAWNKARKKLKKAQTVFVYVPEDIYLTIKRSIKHFNLKLM